MVGLTNWTNNPKSKVCLGEEDWGLPSGICYQSILAGLLLAIYPCVFDFPSFVFFVLRVFFVFILPSVQIRENRDQPTSAGRGARGSDDVRRVRILLDG